MQRFLISVIIPALASWGICTYIVFFTLPQNTRWIILFLATLFVALELTLGTLLYMLRNRTAPNWLDKRELFRETMLITLPLTLAIPTYLFLRYTAADSWYLVAVLVIITTFSEYLIFKRIL